VFVAQNVLVTTSWVAERVGRPGYRLVEVDVDTLLYREGHIAGAVDFNWTTQLQDQVRRDVLSQDALEALLGRCGIKETDTVILYGDNNNWFAAYAYWILKMYGHKQLCLMDGGRKKWVLENRPMTTDVSAYTPGIYRAQKPDPALRARQVDVLTGLGQLALVDVRSPQEFTGEVIAPPGMTETAQRGGHIPGAVSIPWAQAVNEDGSFKSADALQALYGSKGITPDRDVIAYCRIGERSSHTWFVLREILGYPSVRNYDGSWTEWGSMVGVPIER
jgi:thiosulfate/3-mercaptopyruvate sulfurtransferase